MTITEQILDKYSEKMRLRGFTADTKKNYLYYFTQLVRRFGERVAELPVSEIESYIDSLNIENENTQGVLICAIRFYYIDVLGRKEKLYKITRAKKRERLHDLLSLEEVVCLLRAIKNPKQRAMVQLLYSCALRNSEARHAMTNQVDWKSSRFKVVGGKGKKDRYVKIPVGTLNILKTYCEKYFYDFDRPQLLFRGQKQGEYYSARSLQAVVENAAKVAGINKEVKPHTLRHACATHWRSAGMQLDDIRDLLGHSSTKTTETYLHSGIEDIENRLEDASKLMRKKFITQSKINIFTT